jgi:hypothetical protein
MNNGFNSRRLDSQQHGYVPPGAPYFLHDGSGMPAPQGLAFNLQGELVQLPYDPWAHGPQMAWEDPNNPDYLEYAQGRMTIEGQPSADPRLPARYGKHLSVGHVAPITQQDVTLVPQSEYLGRDGDEVSQQDEGTGSAAVFDMPASIARTRYKLSREIQGVVQVDPPTPGSPLLVVPAGNSEGGGGPVAFFGGAVSLGICQYGHLGTSTQIVFDVLPGSLVKIPTVDSFMKITGRMSPRYFASSDAGASPTLVRSYLLFPGGPVLTNDSFSNLPPNIMELQGGGTGTVVAAGTQANPINYSGWCAKGMVPIPDQETLPVRIFRGSVPSSGPTGAFTNRARIPIPQGAISVAIFGGFYNPADTPSAVTVEWTQNLDVSTAVLGPFPSDPESPVRIVQGATSIDVFGGNSAVGGSIEVPFFAVFYLNV